jgi:hypothetical protein
MTQMSDNNPNTHLSQQQQQQHLLQQHGFNSPLQVIPTGQFLQHQHLSNEMPLEALSMHQQHSMMHPGFQLLPQTSEQQQLLYPYNMTHQQFSMMQQQHQHQHSPMQQNHNHHPHHHQSSQLPKSGHTPVNLPHLIVPQPSGFGLPQPLIAVQQQQPNQHAPYILTAVPHASAFSANTATSPISTTPSSSFNSSSPSTSNSPTSSSRANLNSNNNSSAQNTPINGILFIFNT